MHMSLLKNGKFGVPYFYEFAMDIQETFHYLLNSV